MWNNCGVVRNEGLLQKGLKKLEELKSRAENLDIRVDTYSADELVMGFNLKASICAAEATLLSAIERRESRGSHQRSDYPAISSEQSVNYKISMNTSNELTISQKKISEPQADLKKILANTNKINDFSGKLLE